MSVIKKLPEKLIRQIAAGEVVVRPVSIVKELIENAIDSGATEINITAHDGGKTFIQVEDNGCGMELEDLKICLDHHATSKLEDLWSISTLGFRGEALYAISSVADIEIKTSRNEDSYILTSRNQVQDIQPSKPRLGTRVSVSNLFQNTPARLKFLRADYTEWNLILDYVQKISLAYPHITWFLYKGSKVAKKYSAIDVQSRIEDVFGVSEQFFKIDYKQDGYSLEGLFSKSHYPNNNFVLFVNNRYVRDKGIMGCIRSVLADYIPERRWPLGILKLTVPANEIDVNIHPTKEEVRLVKWNLIRNIIVSSIYNALNVDRAMANHSRFVPLYDLYSPASDEAKLNKSDESKDKIEESENQFSYEKVKLPMSNNKVTCEISTNKPYEHSSISYDMSKNNNPDVLSNNIQNTLLNKTVLHNTEKEDPLHNGEKYRVLGQFKNSYIMVETSDGILFIDQHAVHERYVYESMKKEINEHSVEQKLLIPMDLYLTPKQLSALNSLDDKLKKWGLVIENDKLISIPSFWSLNKVKYLLDIFFTALADFDTECQDRMLWGKFLADIACKNSIRAGTALNDQQLENLVKAALEGQGVCNHGRKSTYLLKLKDIEKMFDRV